MQQSPKTPTLTRYAPENLNLFPFWGTFDAIRGQPSGPRIKDFITCNGLIARKKIAASHLNYSAGENATPLHIMLHIMRALQVPPPPSISATNLNSPEAVIEVNNQQSVSTTKPHIIAPEAAD